MKTTSLLLYMLFIANVSLRAQVTIATNFIAYDCNGISHNLFNELDSGTVVVLDWVMPCSGCVGPTFTAYDVVEGYYMSHPGKVKLYLLDDFGDASCATLASWRTSNGLGNKMTLFSDSSIHWSDYGEYSMPKVVVVGGTGHTVYYNDIGASASAQADIQTAINQALGVTGIASTKPFSQAAITMLDVNTILVDYNLLTSGTVTIKIYNVLGALVHFLEPTQSSIGTYRKQIDMTGLLPGLYFLRLTTGETTETVQFILSR